MNRFQEAYEIRLRGFLLHHENEGKTEIDFINQEIQETEILIQEIEAQDIKKEILESKEHEYFKRLGPETEGYEEALNDVMNTHKKRNLGKLAEYESLVREYKFKLIRLPNTPAANSNKSNLFNGKSLNLTERIKIANAILNFEGQIRKLNISDTDKYQLMSYILGNDVSNVRNVVNGTRPNKIREDEINSYLKNLKI